MAKTGEKFQTKLVPTRPRISAEMISHNPLYMLTFLRNLARLEERPTPGELALIRNRCSMLHGCPVEELREEFNNVLLNPAVFTSLGLLVETGLLGELIPELLRGKGMKQSHIHPDDVLTHNLLTCSLVKPSLHLRLAGLLHDVGKPDHYLDDPLLGRRFPNHSHRSARLVPLILGRFSYSTQLVEQVRLLVANHMFIWVPQHGPEPVRQLMEQVGKNNIVDLVELITSDRKAIWGEKIKDSNKALKRTLARVIMETKM